VLSQLDALIF